MSAAAGFHWDFMVLLSIATLVTGAVWIWETYWRRPRRLAAGGAEKATGVVEFCRSFFPVIAAVLILRAFIAEPFRIPSGSMIPTLSVGDFILVNKFAYGLRDPVIHRRWVPVGGWPQRGDVVVFRWPVDPSKDFIKRIVGLPGDRLQYIDKQLYVNGEPALLQPTGVFSTPIGAVRRFEESLGPVPHQIITHPERPADDFDFTVPEGQYFAMGDNRDGSDDSRRWGTVPQSHLVGKAFLIWMSWDGENTRVDFSRIGMRVR
jgi:signal peptidase I